MFSVFQLEIQVIQSFKDRSADAHSFVFLMVFEPYKRVQPSIVLVWCSADNISIVILCQYLYCIGKQWCTTDNISFVNTCSADCFLLPGSSFSHGLLFFFPTPVLSCSTPVFFLRTAPLPTRVRFCPGFPFR